MTSRVRGGGPLPGAGRADGTAKGAERGSIRDQVEDSLFGKRKPEALTDDDEALAELARLEIHRKKLARLAQDKESDYRLVLADGPLITIVADGEIYTGKHFLATWANSLEARVGALAHEIGHRPKRWAEVHKGKELSKEEGEELCRLEETRADMFTGFALSQLGLRWEPFIAYVEQVGGIHPHRIYFSVEARIETIGQAYDSGLRRTTNMRKLFPEFARNVHAKYDLGEG